MADDVLRSMLLYFILPLWLAAGFADYLCHRASNIATTSGPKESLLHLLQFGEMAIPVLAALFLEINALIIGAMIVCLVLHEATAMWDVSYAAQMREVKPIEQHVHSVLEMLPLMGLLMIIALHWEQFKALFGLSAEAARTNLVLKHDPLPTGYVVTVLTAVLIFEVLPYIEELIRGLRAKSKSGK
jgi:hypothetical protein